MAPGRCLGTGQSPSSGWSKDEKCASRIRGRQPSVALSSGRKKSAGAAREKSVIRNSRIQKGGERVYRQTAARGKSFTGKEIARKENITDPKRYLVENIDLFGNCLAETLLAHAAGRDLSFGDRREFEQLVVEVREKGNGLRDLIVAFVLSESFGRK